MKHILLAVFSSFCFLSPAQSLSTSFAAEARGHAAPLRPEASDCANSTAINIIIDEAISCGAPTYNAGNHIGCYRIYEGAAYKILYKYGGKCKDVKKLLEAALELSYGDYSSTEKAWIMRKAFDEILGVPTTTK